MKKVWYKDELYYYTVELSEKYNYLEESYLKLYEKRTSIWEYSPDINV